MKLTAIKGQVKSKHFFSIFIDNEFAFSLSQAEIVNNDLRIGKEISEKELRELKAVSSADKLYVAALKLVAARPKSEWEIKTYLSRKGASPSLAENILNKLSKLDLANDYKYADMFVRNQNLHSPASRRKIISKLQQKRVKAEAIEQALENSAGSDVDALRALIKRKSSKYPDQNKLMAYLSRQGFSYSDIKSALNESNDD